MSYRQCMVKSHDSFCDLQLQPLVQTRIPASYTLDLNVVVRADVAGCIAPARFASTELATSFAFDSSLRLSADL